MFFYLYSLSAVVLVLVPFVLFMAVLKSPVLTVGIKKRWPIFLGSMIVASCVVLVGPSRDWRVAHIPLLSSDAEKEQVAVSNMVKEWVKKESEIRNQSLLISQMPTTLNMIEKSSEKSPNSLPSITVSTTEDGKLKFSTETGREFINQNGKLVDIKTGMPLKSE